MFSPRVCTALALCLAVAAALPAATDKPDRDVSVLVPRPVSTITEDDFDQGAWFTFPLFGNLLAPLWRLFPSFADLGPKIVSDDNKFNVIVNAKEYKKEDLKVKVKGFFIFVQGVHEAKSESDIFDRQFFHTYTLPVNASGADVTAELYSDGYLVVSCPLSGAGGRQDDLDREVEILAVSVPYVKDAPADTPAAPDSPATPAAPAPSTAAPAALPEDEDRKEATTPVSERELITEKDNSIPHGTNEITP